MIIVFLSKLIIMYFLARLLTPAEFGLIGAGMIVINYCRFVNIGLGPALIQREN